MEKVGEAAADMKVFDGGRSFLPHDESVMVACPEGCVRGKVYFDSNTLARWLTARGKASTIEAVRAYLRCRVCGERPAEIRIVGRLRTTKLAVLPGMAPDGRSMLTDKRE